MQKYWYFSRKDKKLRHDDNRTIRLGRTHKVECEPILCQQGLHASKNILDALNYAPGTVIWQVELGGKIVHGDDKSVGTERTYVAGGFDIEDILREFARKCALDVIHLWDAPHVVIKYLKTGDESLRSDARAAVWAARDARAAWAAAWAARDARDAARDARAAWAAAWAARDARDAAWAARDARAAAWAARDARAAAWAARDARAAAWAAQNRRLTRMVLAEIKKRAK
jgi:hypothetical protein